MTTWIALIRGINVGGRNRISMKILTKIFDDLGCREIKTYIQSGNIVFSAEINSVAEFERNTSEKIGIEVGFSPVVRLISAEHLKQAISRNPFPSTAEDPKTLHLFLLVGRPSEVRIRDARELLSGTESMVVAERVLYLQAPDGIARSRFVKGVDNALQMPTTSRNWRTITKLVELASGDL